MKQADQEEVRRLIREREAEKERERQEAAKRRLGKSGQPASGLVDTPDTEYEE